MTQFLFQPEKVLDCRSGIHHIISNIDVCSAVAAHLATTLGPYGLDKLFYGKKLLLTNDGATIMENMEFKHPVAKMLCALSKSQDKEVGDGTTSVVLLTSSILNSLMPHIKEGVSIETIREALKNIRKLCTEHIKALRIDFTDENLVKLAQTSMNSKSIRGTKEHFAKLLIEALNCNTDLHVVKVSGGALSDSCLIHGIAFEKTFTYAGYEQQPRKIEKPKICCLNVELEWKSERDNAEMRIESVAEYQKIVDAEYKIIDRKLEEIVESGANVVLSSASIGDYATQYFARKGIFSAGRVRDLQRIAKAFGGSIYSSTAYARPCQGDLYEERQLGDARYNYLEGTEARCCTLVLRGPGSEILEEVERSVHDAICVVKTAMRNRNIICGGGAPEMQLSKLCRDHSFKKDSAEMFVYRAVSMGFEKLPAQLATNFGLDSVVILQNLRQAHATGTTTGVGMKGASEMLENGVLEPMEVKLNMVKAAFNAVDAILSVDATIIAKK